MDCGIFWLCVRVYEYNCLPFITHLGVLLLHDEFAVQVLVKFVDIEYPVLQL